ncbi:MAG TPA: phage tail protein [Polyangiaceae bacterium]|nr:phage tail protein [Polyangiaceae bacterium]
MAQFTVNSYRQDPYKNYKFIVSWDGKPVAGVSKVSPLKKTTQVIKHRDGADPSTVRKSLGQTDWDEITLERGVTHDTAFEQWANKVWDYPNSSKLGQEVSLKDFRKDIVIDVMNEAGQKVISYKVYRCWPSSFTALPELDGNGNAVAIQSLVLQTEGWERDESVAEPSEPSFSDPAS